MTRKCVLAGVLLTTIGLFAAAPGRVPKDFRFSIDRTDQVVASSGWTTQELNARLDASEAEERSRPFVATRAKWLATVFDHARLAVKSDDVFVDWFQDWQLLERRRVARVKAFRDAHPEVRRSFNGAGLDASHTCPDWESILALGPKGLADRARARRATAANDDERLFLDCVAEVYDAMARLCVRWAGVAEGVGARDCAATLREIAVHPPRTLREALQLMLVYDRCQEAEGECVRSQGMFDRLYIKFYRDDLAAGRETRASAKELVRRVFDKMYEQAHPNGKNFTFGGYGRDGRPVWNELTEIAFELHYELNRINPKLTYRYGAKTPREQLLKVARCLADGRTAVVFFNEETAKEMFTRRGKDPADAADGVLIGCYEPGIQGREVIASMSVQFNLAKPLEAALNRGRSFDGKPVGPTCEMPADYAAFEREYFRQLGDMIDGGLACERVYAAHWYDLNPAPFLSGGFRDAIAAARDCHRGSMKYNQSGVMLGGVGTVADSLAAVRWLVEEAKLVTVSELAQILKDDWRGHEELRLQARRKPPKWGNNDDRADALARKVSDFVARRINTAPNGHGGTFQAGLWSIDNDRHFGRWTAATPDGRRAGERLSRNNAATDGCGREGMTALLLSCAKLDQADAPDGFIVDVILPASAQARDPAAAERIVVLLETFGKMGGQSIHLNCFNAKMLRDAQAHPEKYEDLQVRVCGWNVRWNDLPKIDQDHFIATAEAQE